MKKILLASLLVGVAAAGVIIYLSKNTDALDEIEDAADSAEGKISRHARKAARTAKRALNGALN
ncbi:hypothetical protein GA0116948_108149 [Chitinophaga costaii]|uniref:YtxH-like protein n=1 Tax=Chitinophaga costaii TaxID=1335309 RepID=A0A1C4EIT4_9BACT|nr:hypothetical protein [Chitinophaga costaii]SCC43497.1 hypothetical protein GA0116948_108149 [Chitinophaga costaii]